MKLKKQKKPPLYIVRMSAVLRYFYNNRLARAIAASKPMEFYAENDTDTIIEIIRGELPDERAD